MSHENPGDGIRCDHCNCAAAETREGRLGFLVPNLGELLCSLCVNAAAQATYDAQATDPNTGLRWVTVRNERYRKETMADIGRRLEDRHGA